MKIAKRVALTTTSCPFSRHDAAAGASNSGVFARTRIQLRGQWFFDPSDLSFPLAKTPKNRTIERIKKFSRRAKNPPNFADSRPAVLALYDRRSSAKHRKMPRNGAKRKVKASELKVQSKLYGAIYTASIRIFYTAIIFDGKMSIFRCIIDL